MVCVPSLVFKQKTTYHQVVLFLQKHQELEIFPTNIYFYPQNCQHFSAMLSLKIPMDISLETSKFSVSTPKATWIGTDLKGYIGVGHLLQICFKFILLSNKTFLLYTSYILKF